MTLWGADALSESPSGFSPGRFSPVGFGSLGPPRGSAAPPPALGGSPAGESSAEVWASPQGGGRGRGPGLASPLLPFPSRRLGKPCPARRALSSSELKALGRYLPCDADKPQEGSPFREPQPASLPPGDLSPAPWVSLDGAFPGLTAEGSPFSVHAEQEHLASVCT